MSRPRVLDLCCGAGGTSMGLYQAGFDVVGVDINPQPDYPFEFHRANAVAFPLDGFDAYAAGPPCQLFSRTARAWNGSRNHPDILAAVRHRFQATGKPYVIENVMEAPLENPVMLCGSMFDYPIERHRGFEANFHIPALKCDHVRQWYLWPNGFSQRNTRSENRPSRVVSVFGNGGGPNNDLETWSWAMGIDWMTQKTDIAQAMPPVYTLYIGEQMLRHINEGRKQSKRTLLQTSS